MMSNFIEIQKMSEWFKSMPSTDNDFIIPLSSRCDIFLNSLKLSNVNSKHIFFSKITQILDFYKSKHIFPNIFIVNDMSFHFSEVNDFTTEFYQILTAQAKEMNFDMPKLVKDFERSLHIRSYMITNDAALLSENLQWRISYKQICDKKKCYELSSQLVDYLFENEQSVVKCADTKVVTEPLNDPAFITFPMIHGKILVQVCPSYNDSHKIMIIPHIFFKNFDLDMAQSIYEKILNEKISCESEILQRVGNTLTQAKKENNQLNLYVLYCNLLDLLTNIASYYVNNNYNSLSWKAIPRNHSLEREIQKFLFNKAVQAEQLMQAEAIHHIMNNNIDLQPVLATRFFAVENFMNYVDMEDEFLFYVANLIDKNYISNSIDQNARLMYQMNGNIFSLISKAMPHYEALRKKNIFSTDLSSMTQLNFCTEDDIFWTEVVTELNKSYRNILLEIFS